MANPYQTPHAIRESQPKGSKPFTFLELLAVLVIVGVLVALLLPAIQRPLVYPVSSTVRNCMLQIDMAATSSLSNDGTAPANVGELKLLIENGYIDASLDGEDILSKMISTGTDYWGNPLVMQPVPEKPGTVELRSIGPDGKYDQSENSDDISIQFRTSIN